MNKLATIQRIHSIQPHPNADNLSIGKVLEWPVVIKKDQFKENELIIFITIDSIVPETEYFEFMKKQKFRIWNARFRGSPSSGLVCPLSILPEREILPEEGGDVSEILGITKYERPLDLTVCGDAAGGFPTSLISISDEDNMLSNSNSLKELEDKEIYITQKVDGSSTTFIFNDGEFKACSRRFELKEGSGFPWFSATKYDLKNKLTALGRNLAIQAESVGNKLNGNRMGIDGIELRIFRAKNLDTRELYNYQELKELSKQLEIPIVDEIIVCQFNKDIHTIDWFKNLADKQIYSTNGQPAEGLVVAPVNPFYSNTLGKYWSLKIINSSYKQS
jgi:RNA ligase (TIGR02306 family)